MPYKREDIRYSDFKSSFIIHPIKKDLALDTNENAVRQSILHLCFTDKYERPFNPSIGAGLKKYLFENINHFTASQIEDRITETINAYEPRAILHKVEVKTHPENNSYEAEIIFSVINNSNPVTLNVILNRVR